MITTKDSKTIVTCERCHCQFETEQVNVFGTMVAQHCCDQCLDEHRKGEVETANRQLQQRRFERFKDRCPKGMFYFDRDRFPSELARHDRVINADVAKSGVLIHGRTGVGKSRSIWQLAQRLVVKDGLKVEILEDRAFGRLIERSFNESGSGHDQLIRRFQYCDVLIIDDIGKARLTDRVESDLFDIVDHRYSEEKPMCFTTQFTGEPLRNRFGCKETGAAIVRRIIETTEAIYFKAKA